MKVIDLLNRIANGEEVPKYIKVYNDIYEYETFNKLYWNSNDKQLLDVYNGRILNYEVEEIEEDKKIERLLWCNVEGYSTKAQLLELRENLTLQFNKINEIIDKINED